MEPTLIEQAETLKAELATAIVELVKIKADLAAAESLAADAEKATAEAKAELATARAELVAIKESVATVTTAREKAEFDRDAAKAEQVKAEQALADLKAKVSTNPAFAHAAAGRSALKVEGAPSANLIEQLQAISDPNERAKFRAKNYDALLAQSLNNQKG